MLVSSRKKLRPLGAKLGAIAVKKSCDMKSLPKRTVIVFSSVPASESVISTCAIGSLNAPAKRATGYALAAAASVILFGLLSPASAAARATSVLTRVEIGITSFAISYGMDLIIDCAMALTLPMSSSV